MKPMLVLQMNRHCIMGCCGDSFPRDRLVEPTELMMAQKGVEACKRAIAIKPVDVMVGAYGTAFMRSNNPAWCVDQLRKTGVSKIWIMAAADYQCVNCVISVARSNADYIVHWFPTSSHEVVSLCRMNLQSMTTALQASYLESKRLGTRTTFAICSLAKKATQQQYNEIISEEIRDKACIFGNFSGCMDWATNPERFENTTEGFDLHQRKIIAVTMKDEVYKIASGKWERVGLVKEDAIERALAEC